MAKRKSSSRREARDPDETERDSKQRVGFATLAMFVACKTPSQKSYEIHNHPLSREVFWVYEGKWHHFPIVGTSKGPVIIPPAEYQRVFGLVPPMEEEASNPPPVMPQRRKKSFRCPKCGEKMSVDPRSVGKTVRCPGCGVTGRIPQ
jgi:predicted RNA-binding Zn-ribbon protein involved in translation (DUF1610 family)